MLSRGTTMRAFTFVMIMLCPCALGAPLRAQPHAPTPPERTTFDLGAIPADTMGLSRTPGRGGAMVLFLANEVRDDAPPCAEAIFARVTASFQLWRMPGDHGSTIFEGQFDRGDVERCLGEVMVAQRTRTTIERRGEVTKVSWPDEAGTPTSYLGFGQGFVAWHREEARARELVARRPRGGPTPAVATLFSRIDPAFMSVVYANDFTTRPFGVASRGYVFVLRIGVPNVRPTAVLRLLCPSTADAERLASAIRAVAARPDVPATVQTAVRSAGARAVGAEVELDAMSFFAAPDAIRDLVAWLGVPEARE